MIYALENMLWLQKRLYSKMWEESLSFQKIMLNFADETRMYFTHTKVECMPFTQNVMSS